MQKAQAYKGHALGSVMYVFRRECCAGEPAFGGSVQHCRQTAGLEPKSFPSHPIPLVGYMLLFSTRSPGVIMHVGWICAVVWYHLNHQTLIGGVWHSWLTCYGPAHMIISGQRLASQHDNRLTCHWPVVTRYNQRTFNCPVRMHIPIPSKRNLYSG